MNNFADRGRTLMDAYSQPQRHCPDCPAAELLREFASGSLGEPQFSELIDHINSCGTCADRLDTIGGQGDTIASYLRRPDPLEALRKDPRWNGLLAREFSARSSGSHSTASTAIVNAGGVSGSPGVAAGQAGDRAGNNRLGSGFSKLVTKIQAIDTAVKRPALLPAGNDRYQVESEIGSGTFGVVYLAYDTKLDRRIALKIPQSSSDLSRDARDRVLDEARSAARLNHPAIVTIFDVGEDLNGRPYISLEYIEGISLQRLLKKGPMPFAQSARLVGQVAEALAYAHASGMTHRDIKPGNILIDGEGRPHVSDFGLALDEQKQWAHNGEIAGTPPYMAPEQVRGEAHFLDGRGDIWSLGVVLYELLTRRRPFSGLRKELFDEILHREPRPPRQIDGRIPAELERICLKCLCKSPAGRYSTASDLADDLRNWAGTVTESTAAAPGARMPRWARPIVAALLVAPLLAVFAFSPGLTMRPAERSAIADVEQKLPGNPLPEFTEEGVLDLDVVAAALRWYDLRSHPAHRLVFSKSSRTNVLVDNAPAGASLHLDSVETAMLSMGTTSVTDFEFEIGFSKNAHSGTSGLFFGVDEGVTFTAVNQEWHGQRIGVEFLESGGCRVCRDLYRMRRLRSGPVMMDISSEWAVEVEPPEFGETVLRIEVVRGQLRSVSWDGVELEELIDDPHVPANLLPRSAGQLGVFNQFGAVTFHSARFQPTRR